MFFAVSIYRSLFRHQINVADPKQAKHFYSKVFGWDFKVDQPFPEEESSEFRFPGSQLGGAVVRHVADLHKKPGKGAVEVYVYVDSIEETISVCSLISSFIRLINFISIGSSDEHEG